MALSRDPTPEIAVKEREAEAKVIFDFGRPQMPLGQASVILVN